MSRTVDTVSVPGTHTDECLCSDCKGARVAYEAAERRKRKDDWQTTGWSNMNHSERSALDL